MEHITHMQKRIGVDLGYHESNLRPENDEGCVGKSGLDKSLSLERILEIVYKMKEKPNVIIKAGPRAKWYLHLWTFKTLIINFSKCVLYLLIKK